MQFAAPDTVTTTQWNLLPTSVIKWVVPRTSIATPVIPMHTRQNRRVVEDISVSGFKTNAKAQAQPPE
jgi:hypothetical protein